LIRRKTGLSRAARGGGDSGNETGGSVSPDPQAALPRSIQAPASRPVGAAPDLNLPAVAGLFFFDLCDRVSTQGRFSVSIRDRSAQSSLQPRIGAPHMGDYNPRDALITIRTLQGARGPSVSNPYLAAIRAISFRPTGSDSVAHIPMSVPLG